MIARLDPDVPVIVDSAGCGAAMKDYGRLLGTATPPTFADRVYDIQEWLALHVDRLPTVSRSTCGSPMQDPCHLRHVQRVHLATRTVLGPFVRELVELDDDGLCCGAGRRVLDLQPELAGQIRDRKLGCDRAGRVPTWSPARTPAARCTSPPVACPPSTRCSSSTAPSISTGST